MPEVPSYRTIKIDYDIVRELKKFKLKKNELILGNEKFHKNEDSIIFQNCHRHYLTPSTICDTMQSYCAKKLLLIIKATMALDIDISMRFCNVNQVQALNMYQIDWAIKPSKQ